MLQAAVNAVNFLRVKYSVSVDRDNYVCNLLCFLAIKTLFFDHTLHF